MEMTNFSDGLKNLSNEERNLGQGKYGIERRIVYEFGGIHLSALGINYDWKEASGLLLQENIQSQYMPFIEPLQEKILHESSLSIYDTLRITLEIYPNQSPIWAVNLIALLTLVDVIESDKNSKGRNSSVRFISHLKPIPNTEADPYGALYHFWGYLYRILLEKNFFYVTSVNVLSFLFERNDPTDRYADKLAIETGKELWKILCEK